MNHVALSSNDLKESRMLRPQPKQGLKFLIIFYKFYKLRWF